METITRGDFGTRIIVVGFTIIHGCDWFGNNECEDSIVYLIAHIFCPSKSNEDNVYFVGGRLHSESNVFEGSPLHSPFIF